MRTQGSKHPIKFQVADLSPVLDGISYRLQCDITARKAHPYGSDITAAGYSGKYGHAEFLTIDKLFPCSFRLSRKFVMGSITSTVMEGQYPCFLRRGTIYDHSHGGAPDHRYF